MTEIIPCKVNRDRKITIPSPVSQKYNIKEGDIILLVDDNGELKIKSKDDYLPDNPFVKKVRSVGFV